MGVQSFGGGSSTFLMMHQTCIRRGWFSEDAFIREWTLAQIAPGINLVKLSIMIGYKLRGWPGVIAVSTGLMIPSAAITILMTAGFTTISGIPMVQAALKGVLPATIGLSIAMAIQMAAPLIRQANHESKPRLAAHLFILATSALLMAVLGVSPVLVMVFSGIAGIILLALLPARQQVLPPQESSNES